MSARTDTKTEPRFLNISTATGSRKSSLASQSLTPTYTDSNSTIPLNIHSWRINALTTSTLRQTDFLLRAKDELKWANAKTTQACMNVLASKNIVIPSSRTQQKSKNQPVNTVYIGLLLILQYPPEKLCDKDWIEFCREYLKEFPKLCNDLLEVFGVVDEILSPLSGKFPNLQTITFEDVGYPGENDGDLDGSGGRKRVVTFDEKSVSKLDLEEEEKVPVSPRPRIQKESHDSGVSISQIVEDIPFEQTLFQSDSQELQLQGQRIVYDLHVAMMDRPSETKELVVKHEEFFNRIKSCVGISNNWKNFEHILYQPREVMDDLTWIRALLDMLDSAPALQSHFKEVVGYDHYDSEDIDVFDEDEEDDYYYDKGGRSPYYTDYSEDGESIMGSSLGPVSFDALNEMRVSASGSVSPVIPAVQELTILDVPMSKDSIKELFGVWDGIFKHLRDNPAIVKGLPKDYPQFFVNIRDSFNRRPSPIPPSTGTTPPESNASGSPSNRVDGPKLMEFESAEYLQFKQILLADRTKVPDEEWLSEVHTVFGTNQNLLDQFKEIVAYELEVDEDEINRYSFYNMAEYAETDDSTDHYEIERTGSLVIRVGLRDELSTLSSADIEKKYATFFSQLHQHLRYHRHPPRAFSRFMRILRAPRDFIPDDKWIGLLTHSFLGGSRKLRKTFRNLVQASVTHDGFSYVNIDSDDEEWSGEYAVEFREASELNIDPTKEISEEELVKATAEVQKKLDAVVDKLLKDHDKLFKEIEDALVPSKDHPNKIRPMTSVDPFTILKDHLRVLRNVVHDTAFVVRLEEIMGMSDLKVYTTDGLYSKLARILGVRQLAVRDEVLHVESPVMVVQTHHFLSTQPNQQSQLLFQPPVTHATVRDQIPASLPALEIYVLLKQKIADDKVFARIMHDLIDLKERERQTSSQQLEEFVTNGNVNGVKIVSETEKPQQKLTDVLRTFLLEYVSKESDVLQRFDGFVKESYGLNWVESAPQLGLCSIFELLHPSIDVSLGVGKSLPSTVKM